MRAKHFPPINYLQTFYYYITAKTQPRKQVTIILEDHDFSSKEINGTGQILPNNQTP